MVGIQRRSGKCTYEEEGQWPVWKVALSKEGTRCFPWTERSVVCWCLKCLKRNYENLEKQNFAYVLWKFKFQERMFKLITVDNRASFQWCCASPLSLFPAVQQGSQSNYTRNVLAGAQYLQCQFWTILFFPLTSACCCLLPFLFHPPLNPLVPLITWFYQILIFWSILLVSQSFRFGDMIFEKNLRTSFPLNCSF